MYAFGPVPSRRLGRSLGVDPLPPKTCDHSCVYCQLGRTRRRTIQRREFIPRERILADCLQVLEESDPPDWVTFVGSGEPTLHTGLGWLIREVKDRTGLPVAVITNGSLLFRRDVREDLLAADAVLPSLDAGTATLFRRIVRPHPQVGFERNVAGLLAFGDEFEGRIWLEVMLVAGLNDTDEALDDLTRILVAVAPDEIQLNVPTRPPAESWVRPPGEERIARALEILGESARVIGPAGSAPATPETCPVTGDLVDILRRHPLGRDQLDRERIRALEGDDRVRVVERFGKTFYCAAGSSYA